MNRMVEPIRIPIPRPNRSDDEAAIVEVIRNETNAFLDADFEAWAKCWLQQDRTTHVCISATEGLDIVTGWPDIAAGMKHVLENDLGCSMVDFRQENHRIAVDGSMAWVAFDGWSENADGETWETFETRILEREDGLWKIAYLSFVEKRSDHIAANSLTVDKAGQLIWASAQTLEKIKEHPILTLSAGRVRARRRDWDRALQEAIELAGRYHGFFELRRFSEETGGPFRYPAVLGETDEGGVAVVHVSVRDCATHLQFDVDGSLDRRLTVAQAVFGLSDGQVKIARHIANGEGLKAASDALGISVNTARTHLTRLYEKTGVSSQTALVRLLLSVG